MKKGILVIVAIAISYWVVKRGIQYVVERQEPLTRAEARQIVKLKEEWDSTPDRTLHSTEDMTAELEQMWANS